MNVVLLKLWLSNLRKKRNWNRLTCCRVFRVKRFTHPPPSQSTLIKYAQGLHDILTSFSTDAFRGSHSERTCVACDTIVKKSQPNRMTWHSVTLSNCEQRGITDWLQVAFRFATRFASRKIDPRRNHVRVPDCDSTENIIQASYFLFFCLHPLWLQSCDVKSWMTKRLELSSSAPDFLFKRWEQGENCCHKCCLSDSIFRKTGQLGGWVRRSVLWDLRRFSQEEKSVWSENAQTQVGISRNGVQQDVYCKVFP